MKPAMFLRIASIVAALETIGHTLLFVSYVPTHGPAERAVIDAMKSAVFNFGGFTHSYWDLYFGYGLFTAVSCAVEAGVLWLLASIARQAPRQVRPMVAVFFLGEVGYAALVWKYFFLIPIVFHSAMALLLGCAFAAAGRRAAQE